MKLKFRKRELAEVEKLMANLNWKWREETVTTKMLKKTAKRLYKELSKDIEITDSSTGGITVSRDTEIPEIISVKFEIEIAEEVEN